MPREMGDRQNRMPVINSQQHCVRRVRDTKGLAEREALPYQRPSHEPGFLNRGLEIVPPS